MTETKFLTKNIPKTRAKMAVYELLDKVKPVEVTSKASTKILLAKAPTNMVMAKAPAKMVMAKAPTKIVNSFSGDADSGTGFTEMFPRT